MTLTVLMDIPIRPGATHVDDAFHHDLPATRAFPGNELTEVLADADNPAVLTLLTRWSSTHAYETYVAWRATPEGATRLPDIASGPPEFRQFSTHLAFDE